MLHLSLSVLMLCISGMSPQVRTEFTDTDGGSCIEGHASALLLCQSKQRPFFRRRGKSLLPMTRWSLRRRLGATPRSWGADLTAPPTPPRHRTTRASTETPPAEASTADSTAQASLMPASP